MNNPPIVQKFRRIRWHESDVVLKQEEEEIKF